MVTTRRGLKSQSRGISTAIIASMSALTTLIWDLVLVSDNQAFTMMSVYGHEAFTMTSIMKTSTPYYQGYFNVLISFFSLWSIHLLLLKVLYLSQFVFYAGWRSIPRTIWESLIQSKEPRDLINNIGKDSGSPVREIL